MGQTNSMSQDQTLMNDMSVTSPVSHVEMWPYVASAATWSESHKRTASRIVMSLAMKNPPARATGDRRGRFPRQIHINNMKRMLRDLRGALTAMAWRQSSSTGLARHRRPM